MQELAERPSSSGARFAFCHLVGTGEDRLDWRADLERGPQVIADHELRGLGQGDGCVPPAALVVRVRGGHRVELALEDRSDRAAGHVDRLEDRVR